MPVRVVFDLPFQGIRGDQHYPPDHNMRFEMISLKLKVDTKHKLLVLNTSNADEYFQNTPADLRHLS